MSMVPVVAADFAEGAELPKLIVQKIRIGENEGDDLRNVLESSLKDYKGLSAYVQAGREYAEEFYSAAVVAAELYSVLNRIYCKQTNAQVHHINS